ncbi:Lysophosphatidylserine lipase ABHD12 [Taenia solium]|eukprot:TsM_000635000 transcript=TsM_000635000 gene=TsM_000635000
MFIIFVVLPVVGICYFVPIFCAIFPKAAIPLIYLHYLQFSRNQNFSDFPSFGVSSDAASNFYIQSDLDGTLLGTHIRPNATDEFTGQRYGVIDASSAKDRTPIFLYLHGMAFNRAYPHRVEVYKLLSRLGFHVMTIDYRGFGNSGGSPQGEADIVADAISLLRYARGVAPHSPIFIWGSSLGTGIAGSMIKVLNETGGVRPPEGIVLDAPFTNMLAAAYHSPQGKAMRVVLALRYLLKHIFYSLNITYDSEANFQLASCPILILHSADDGIVPIQLGHTVYTTLKKANVDVTFKNLGFQGFGHDRNHEYPGIPSLIRDFVNRAISMPK